MQAFAIASRRGLIQFEFNLQFAARVYGCAGASIKGVALTEEFPCPTLHPVRQSLAWIVELKHLLVWLDGIAICFPGRQSTPEKSNLAKIQGQSLLQNCSASLIARTGAVNHDLFLFGDQRRLLQHFFWRNPARAGNGLRIGQQVKRLANVKEKYFLVGLEQGV